MDRQHIECSVGNLKVGKDTIILNITSAKDCESLKRGLCQVPEGKCYALRAETQYPQVLPYRRRQTKLWDSLTPEEIAEDVKSLVNHKRKIPVKFLRMQEAGDFRNQGDVDKVSRLADLLRGTVTVYTYTARRDLDFSRISSNLVVNGSNFMVSNNFKVTQKIEKGPACRGIAGGGCYGCKLCKTKGGKVIQELLRGGGKSANIKDDTSEHGGVAESAGTELEPEMGGIGNAQQGGLSASLKGKKFKRTTKKWRGDSPPTTFGGIR